MCIFVVTRRISDGGCIASNNYNCEIVTLVRFVVTARKKNLWLEKNDKSLRIRQYQLDLVFS
jgi:hypothetical protein